MQSSHPPKASLPSRIPLWRMIFDQGAITQRIVDHSYPGSGTDEDPFIVSWIDEDPRNPMLFKNSSKWAITSLVSMGTFVVALVSSAYSGSTVEIIEYFQISEELALVGISVFVVGFAVGPLVWAPLSEIYGRRVVFILSSFFLTVFSAGAAGAKNIQTLIILRFFAGSLGSVPMAISGAVIADIFHPIIRGLASGLFAAAPFLGPVLGPIFGGYIAKASGGWQWVQGFLAAFSGVTCLATILLMPETYAPALLQSRAQSLQKATGLAYRTQLDEKRSNPRKVLTTALSRPWVLLFREPIVLLLSLYMSIIYGILYMLFAAYPIVFQSVRGWSESEGGLAFLGILVGILFAIIYIVVVFFDYRKRTLKVSPGRLPPEARLPPSFPACIALPVGLFWFAWTSQPSVHWMAPIAAGVPFGFGMVMVFLPILNYLVDTYTIYAASVLAGNLMLRSIFGAIFPLFTTYMYRNLGPNWAASIPAFLSVACAPMPFLFWLYGPKIRKRCHYAAESEAFMTRVFGGPVTEKHSQNK
ncbi:MFS general substrate transporter [Penicillium brevicompactum]